jgi:hypothetical protein
MLFVSSVLSGFTVAATDGPIGAVKDFLFDDQTWKIRWLVVDTGSWLFGRTVLINASALGEPDPRRKELPVSLTKAQVEGGPSLAAHQPVSRQAENESYQYYGADRSWGYAGMGFTAPGLAVPHLSGGLQELERPPASGLADESDPHLRSAAEVVGYHFIADDEDIGHVRNLVMDNTNWDIRYFEADTSNWWNGQHVLIAPFAVKSIEYLERQFLINITRGQVESSPRFDSIEIVDEAYERKLHGHFGWPGYWYYPK